MSNKELFGKIGLVIVMFALILIILNELPLTWLVEGSVPQASTANTQSLELLWKDWFPATLIQGFVIFAALLGANLQFTAVKKHGDED